MDKAEIAVRDKPASQPSALQILLADPDRLKNFPIETVERMFAMEKEIQADLARCEFAEAFNRVQKAMTPVRRMATNSQTGSKYALAEHVMEMLDPLILREGFSRSLSCADCPVEGQIRFMLTLRRGGHVEQHFIDGAPDYLGPKGNPTKTKIHGMMSSYTLVERHLVCKVFGVQLVADDDGNAGGGIGPGAEKITAEQVGDLEALLDEVKADRSKYLKFFEIEKLGDLQASQLRTATRMLEAKRK